MIRLSQRYAWPLAAALAASAAVVVALHLWPRQNDPCALPQALEATLMIPNSRPTSRVNDDRPEGVFQWSTGTVEAEAWDEKIRFQVLRSHDPRRLYERPIRFVDRKLDPERHRVAWLETPHGPIPVHVIRDHTLPWAHVVAYLFVLGNQPVETPLLTMAGNLFGTLRDGPESLTLFIVDGVAPKTEGGPVEQAALQWLTDAYGYYATFCNGS